MKKKLLLITFLSAILNVLIFSQVFAASTCSDSSHNCGGTGGDHEKGSTCSHTHSGWSCHTCAETTGTGSIGWERKACTSNSLKRQASSTREHSYGYECGDCHAANMTCSGCGHRKKHTCYTPPVHTHSYSAATCTTPPTCSCGATSGTALGHSWSTTWSTDASKHWKK